MNIYRLLAILPWRRIALASAAIALVLAFFLLLFPPSPAPVFRKEAHLRVGDSRIVPILTTQQLIGKAESGEWGVLLDLGEMANREAFDYLSSQYRLETGKQATQAKSPDTLSEPSRKLDFLQMALARIGSRKQLAEILRDLHGQDAKTRRFAALKIMYVGGADAVQALGDLTLQPEWRWSDAWFSLYQILPDSPIPLPRVKDEEFLRWKAWWESNRKDIPRLLSKRDERFDRILAGDGRRILSHRSTPRDLAFSRDGKFLVISTDANMADGLYVHLWNLATGRRESAFKDTWRSFGFGWGIGPAKIALSPDGKRIAVRFPGAIRVLDSSRGSIEAEIPVELTRHPGLSFSPDGNFLAFNTTKSIQIYEIGTGKCREAVPLDAFAPNACTSGPCFSPDGNRLAIGLNVGRDGASYSAPPHEIHLWDARTFHPTQRIFVASEVLPSTSLAFSPDGKSVAYNEGKGQMKGAGTGRERGTRLLDVSTGRSFRYFPPGFEGFASPVFSPDGSILALAEMKPSAASSTVRLWDISTGKEKKTLEIPLTFISCLAFSPNGKTLAVGGTGPRLAMNDVLLMDLAP